MRKRCSICIIFFSLSSSLAEGSSDVVLKQCADFVEQAEKNVEGKIPDLKGKATEVLKEDLSELHKPILVAAQEDGIPFERGISGQFIIDVKLDKDGLRQKCIDAFAQNERKRNLSGNF